MIYNKSFLIPNSNLEPVMSDLIDSNAICRLQQQSIIHWNTHGVVFNEQGFYALVEENHAFNYQLWHAEDRARREDKGFEFVYHAKREIDTCNQSRNNRMEAMDQFLFTLLEPEQHTDCTIHSETPGMMIDRLSILALKSYHMALQTQRTDASSEHQDLCRTKLLVIKQQLHQLALCFNELIEAIKLKKRTFKVYHQFKMYNDPNLNPHIYLKD